MAKLHPSISDASSSCSSSSDPAEVLDEDEIADLVKAIHPSEQADFDSHGYLDCFYSNISTTEPAMQIMLTYLPGIASRLPQQEGRTMIDVGSGPTVYTGFIFRNKVSEINFSDFSLNNIHELTAFKENQSKFSWAPTIRKIALHEGALDHEMASMESQTRTKINKIYKCDVFKPGVLSNPNDPTNPVDNDQHFHEQFDLVTSIFCLEYAGISSDEYKLALFNVLGLLKKGGIFVLGGCMKDRYYKFNYKSYRCHCLTSAELLSGLAENGIDTKDDFVYLNKYDTFIVKGVKR